MASFVIGDKASRPDHYRLHRAALRPLLSPQVEMELRHSANLAAGCDESRFMAFLQQQGLAPLWHSLLVEHGPTQLFSAEFVEALHQARLHAAGVYLLQKSYLERVRASLDASGIDHAVYKGADVRERHYGEPALRSACDIDILVQEQQKTVAIRALRQQGLEYYPKRDNISHEVSLVKGGISVDLHWDIMRPGRTRRPLVAELLARRQDYGSHWGLSNEHSLFITLVHPVFTKYSTTPQASLDRQVDLARMLENRELDWQEVIQLLATSGLKTAAWITLRWFRLITGSGLADQKLETIKPGRLRQSYLNAWLQKNLATRLSARPICIQLGLTLPAHDTARDAIRAVLKKRQAAHRAEREMQRIARAINGQIARQ